MSRAVRRVPASWKHPKNDRGHIPLFEGVDVLAKLKKWIEEYEIYLSGEHPHQKDIDENCRTFSDWDNGPPDPADYMPNWPKEERTHYQMYEITTEGTPISPVTETPEELATWLVQNGASTFADMPASYDQWLAMIVGPGSPPSMVLEVRSTESERE